MFVLKDEIMKLINPVLTEKNISFWTKVSILLATVRPSDKM